MGLGMPEVKMMDDTFLYFKFNLTLDMYYFYKQINYPFPLYDLALQFTKAPLLQFNVTKVMKYDIGTVIH